MLCYLLPLILWVSSKQLSGLTTATLLNTVNKQLDYRLSISHQQPQPQCMSSKQYTRIHS